MKFRSLAAAFLVFVLSCSSALALSDNEYAQMMRNAGFKKADRALSQAWKEAQRKLVKNKTALANLRKDQREWVARGRDSEAEDLMDIEGYDRLKAYTVATNLRAEYLPELAQQYLDDAGGTVKKSENKKAENKKTTPERPANQPKKQTQKANNQNQNIDYPTFGICSGNSVRLRDNPGTDSNVIGRTDKNDQLILLGERTINGDTWYHAANPNNSGTGWISGQFVNVYTGKEAGTPAFKMSMAVRAYLGIKPAKALEVLGSPDKITNDTFFFDPAGRELKEDTYEYSGCILRYVEGRLRHVEVFGTGLNFGDLLIGDSREKLIGILGKPREDENSDSLNYEITSINEAFLFELEDDAITRMTWDEYMDG